MADAVAAEWRLQGEKIVPAAMPMTQLANGVIDRIAPHRPLIVEQLHHKI